jgi:hypothetical protein
MPLSTPYTIPFPPTPLDTLTAQLPRPRAEIPIRVLYAVIDVQECGVVVQVPAFGTVRVSSADAADQVGFEPDGAARVGRGDAHAF